MCQLPRSPPPIRPGNGPWNIAMTAQFELETHAGARRTMRALVRANLGTDAGSVARVAQMDQNCENFLTA